MIGASGTAAAKPAISVRRRGSPLLLRDGESFNAVNSAYSVLMLQFRQKTKMIDPDRALAGREREMPVPDRHHVLGTPLKPPFPDGFEQIVVGMGCFWGAERVFWQAPGVYTTAVGYAGGYTANPSYEEVCSGSTGHTEAVLAVFDPAKTSYMEMLRLFWENHDPTQGMRQGNDVGTQYRSAIYWSTEEQREQAESSRAVFAERLRQASYPEITTEIAQAGSFYYAEDYHQQYLAKNPFGYCGLGGTGVSCPVGLGAAASQG
jgi:peptide-methionine (S)-S-oxide reductase